MSEGQMLPGVQLRVDGDAVVCEGHRHECRRLAGAFRLMLNDSQKLSEMYTKHPEDGCYDALPKLRQRVKDLEVKTEAALFIAGTEIADKERVRLMVKALSSEGEGSDSCYHGERDTPENPCKRCEAEEAAEGRHVLSSEGEGE